MGRLIEPDEALWYLRPLPGPVEGKRTLLHFEAVDYTTTVWVNGREIGAHTGGWTPFSFDITEALKPENNELLVRVDDATEGFQLHGKKMAVEYDPTRHVNIASGGNFWPVGDIANEHRHPHPGFPLEDRRFDDFIKVIGEFGGHGMPIEGHLWSKSSPNWGYGGLPGDLADWKQRYTQSLRMLADLRKCGVAAGVYTQTTDVEVEINDLRTYDRANKVDPAYAQAALRNASQHPRRGANHRACAHF